ncbi:peptide ABC transporter substrate-binding protein [Thermoactinomyces mirandus]|uniref:Peptide ABC transporter substrate-binding protein n=1 Tax=Thermoactinomyces mirandus TaxID=2756294 RepID=A0A7W1XPN0_9BACL|nr:peptide ABC transporter substrate-binding protein [Thermoactinomyces mirandus]MBA4600857.1 peptide ABC transporter substrate-binding protein [Thermoactinomyces mirandus]
MRELIYEIDTDPLSLNPTFVADYLGQIICQAIFEPLYVRNEKNSEWMLGAAISHEISMGGRRHIFVLSSEKRWSDGMPVKAEHFVMAFRRLLSPELAAPMSSNFLPLLHANEVVEGILPEESLGVRAVDDQTLEIMLAYPIPFLKELLGCPAASPIRETACLGNGPYTLAEYIKGSHIRLKANPYYPDSENRIQTILFKIERNLHSTAERYLKKKVDITCNTYFPFDLIKHCTGRNDLYRELSSVLFILQFNKDRHPLFSERNVRRALYQSINKKRIVKKLNYGIVDWDHFIPKGLINISGHQWNQTSNIAYNPEYSRKLWENYQIPELSLLFPDYYPNSEIAKFIVGMWNETLGINMRMEGVSLEEFSKRLNHREFDLCLSLLTPGNAEPLGCLQYHLPDLDEQIQDQFIEYLERAMDEGETRWLWYQKADELLCEELPSLPLFNGLSLYFCSPKIKGYKLFTDGSVSFRQLSWFSSNSNRK